MIRTVLRIFVTFASLPALLRAGAPAENLTKKPNAWFRSAEGRTTLDNILSWQSAHGSWPKNQDSTQKRYSGDRVKLKGTFDNGATVGELRALARAYRVTGGELYQAAALRGFDHVLQAQYPNGGWPQYFPLSKSYHRHITFNDGSMIRVLEFLRDTATSVDFAWLDYERQMRAAQAIERGVDCILKCQVVVDGQPTVWCAQHDEITLAPATARTYELASLSGAESAGILKYLMHIKSPTPDVVRAVKCGGAWYKSVRIDGFRYHKRGGPPHLFAEAGAPPLWARFYECETNRPIFCDRDGVVKYDLAEIGSERRGGYTWYGNWGESVATMYANWPHR